MGYSTYLKLGLLLGIFHPLTLTFDPNFRPGTSKFFHVTTRMVKIEWRPWERWVQLQHPNYRYWYTHPQPPLWSLVILMVQEDFSPFFLWNLTNQTLIIICHHPLSDVTIGVLLKKNNVLPQTWNANGKALEDIVPLRLMFSSTKARFWCFHVATCPVPTFLLRMDSTLQSSTHSSTLRFHARKFEQKVISKAMLPLQSYSPTVDGGNPAPPGMYKTL